MKIALLTLAATLGLTAPALAQYDETAKLLAPDGAKNDEFGNAVAMDAGRIVVGAQRDDDKGPRSGSAYVFDASSQALLFKLTAPNGLKNDFFGFAVAVGGGRIAVGAPLRNSARGAVYVFDAGNGSLLWELTASDSVVDDRFGFALDLDGDRLIVGMPLSGPQNQGAAYVYDLITGQELVKLSVPSHDEPVWLGHDVALAGDLALVGGPFLDNPEVDRGAAYVFDVTTGSLLHELQASDGEAGDRFGRLVDLAGTTAAISADSHDNNRGAVYLFDVVSGAELAELNAVGGGKNDSLGDSLEFDGDRLAVGAAGTHDLGPGSGSVFVFDVPTGAQLVELHASDGFDLDRFGLSVTIDGGRLVAGARGADETASDAGAAYLFSALDCPLTRSCDPAVPNSTGLPAVLDALSCSATQGAALVARDLPPGQFGYLLMGTGSGVVQPPGSMGNLCLAGGPVGRYVVDVATSGAEGRILTQLVFGATGGGTGQLPNPPGGSLAAGQSWGFQLWYRDVGGTSNFTDRVELVFQP